MLLKTHSFIQRDDGKIHINSLNSFNWVEILSLGWKSPYNQYFYVVLSTSRKICVPELANVK